MIVALNNKCNLNKEEFLEYQGKLKLIKSQSKIILCPTLLNISLFNLDNISLGAQNVNNKSDGAFTGEVSANQLKTHGVEYCIVGHSERRAYQLETNKIINEKIKELLKNNITPILCIGETKEERESGKVTQILKKELKEATEDLTSLEKNRLIIAYEPIWSIGTGLIPTIKEIEAVFELIKAEFPKNKILYGGSANEENIGILKATSIIDGYLLGGISLKPEKLQLFLTKLEN